MPIGSYGDILTSRGFQSAPLPPAAAQAASDPAKLLAAIQIAKQIQAQQQANASPLPDYSGTPLATLAARSQASPGVGQLPGTGQVPIQSQDTGVISQPPPPPITGLLQNILASRLGANNNPPPTPMAGNSTQPASFGGGTTQAVIPDVTQGQGQGAGPASLAATTPTPSTGYPGSSIIGDVGNTAGSVADTIGGYAKEQATKIAQQTAALQSQPSAQGDSISASLNQGLAPIVATGSVLAGDIGSAIGPAAKATGSALGHAYDATIGAMSHDTQTAFYNTLGIDTPPTSAELVADAGKLIHLVNYQQQHIGQPLIGKLFYEIVAGNAPLGLSAFAPFFDDATKAQIIAAYQKGGGDGVWQDWVANLSDWADNKGIVGSIIHILLHAGIDIGSDPQTWETLLSGYLASAAEQAATASVREAAMNASLKEGASATVAQAAGESAARAATTEEALAAGQGSTMGSTALNVASRLVDPIGTGMNFITDTAGNIIRVGANTIGGLPGAGYVAKQFTPSGAEQTASDAMDAIAAAANEPGTTGGADIGGGVPITPVTPPPTAADIAANRAASAAPGAGAKFVTEINGNAVYEEVGADGSTVYRVRNKQGDFLAEEPTLAAAQTDAASGPPAGTSSASVDTGAPTTADGKPLTVDASGNVTTEQTAAPTDLGGTATDVPRETPASFRDIPAEGNVDVNAVAPDMLPGETEDAYRARVAQHFAEADRALIERQGVERLAAEQAARAPEVGPVVQHLETLFDQHLAPIMRVDPAVAAQIKTDVEAEIQKLEDQMALPGRWGVDKQIDNAEAGALVREAAQARGIALPADAIARDGEMRLPSKALSKEARVQQILFTPDYKSPESVAARRSLYQQQILAKDSPVQGTVDAIMNGKLRNGKFELNDAMVQNLPEDLRPLQETLQQQNRIAKGTEIGSYRGRVLTNADLGPLTQEQRAEIARVVTDEQGVLYERGQRLQQIHTQVHGPANPNRGFGIVDSGFQKAQALGERVKAWAKPEIPTAFPDELPRRTFEPALEARVQAATLTPDEAGLLSQELPVKGGRTTAEGLKPTESVYQRFERYRGIDQLSDRDAMFATVKDLTDYLHPSTKDRNAVAKLLQKYDTINHVIKDNIQHNILNSVRGITSQIAGDGWNMIVTGHGGAVLLGWGDLNTFEQAVRDMDPTLLNENRAFSILHETGIELPKEMTSGRWNQMFGKNELTGKYELIPGKDTTQLSLVRTTEKIAGKGAATIAKVPAAVLQDKWLSMWKNAFELQRRSSVFVDQFEKDVLRGARGFDLNITQAARKEGMDPAVYKAQIVDEAKARMAARGEGNLYHGVFTADDIRTATGNEQLARQWQSFLKKTAQDANAEQKRVLFSFNTTPFDKKVGRAVYFHYWATRALALHTEAALRNPFLLGLYVKAYDGLIREAKRSGYPPSMMGLLEYFHSKPGFSFFFNPAGILVPYAMLNEIGNSNLPLWRRVGAFLAPPAEGILAVMGQTDNIPDWTGTTTLRGTMQAFLNSMDAHGVHIPGLAGPDGKVSDDAVANMQKWIYSHMNQAAVSSGITSKDYAPYDPKTAEIAQIKAVIIQNGVRDFGPQANWTPAQQKEILDSELTTASGNMNTNARAHEAYVTVTNAQSENKALSVVTPGGSILKYDPLEANRAAYNAIPYGTDQSALTPDQIAAQAAMQTVNASTVPGKTANTQNTTDLQLQTLSGQYAALGTPRQKALYTIYNDIVSGDPAGLTDKSIEIAGVTYQMADVLAMPAADRQVIADHFLQANNGQKEYDDYKAKRTQFLTDNPQFGDFKTYQKAVYADPGGVRAWRTKYATQNPNFGAAMAQQEAFLAKSSPSNLIVQQGLDQWAAGINGYEAANGIPNSLYAQPVGPLSSSATVAAPIGSTTAATTSGGSGSTGSSGSVSTVDQLTQDIAQYQQDSAVLADAMAQAGMPGGIQDYSSPYEQKYIQNAFGDLIPTPTSLLRQYDTWMQAQAPGADTSPAAFAAFYDSTGPSSGLTTTKTTTNAAGVTTTKTVKGWTAHKNALYLSWKNHQAATADTSPAAFDAYLAKLQTQAIPTPQVGSYAP